MQTTRLQADLNEEGNPEELEIDVGLNKPLSKAGGQKRVGEEVEENAEQETAGASENNKKQKKWYEQNGGVAERIDQAREIEDTTAWSRKYERPTGTIERGHIYFFYRPKIEHKEAHSIDDVSRFSMLLVPRPPEFSIYAGGDVESQQDEGVEMAVLEEGADAVPAKETQDTTKKHYRLISIGRKRLPEPAHGGKGHGRKDVFWAIVSAVGDDLHSLEKGMGERTYETMTKGIRHEASARLAGRGAYAIVNNNPRVPSQGETHMGYHLSHPSEMGEIQEALGIHKSCSFIMQVKNPLAPTTGGRRVGLSEYRKAKYPDWILDDIFGQGGKKGRERCGLHFSSVETLELLEHEGAELLMIAARAGDEGLETSLGEGRGEALHEVEERESKETVDEVMRELAMDSMKFPVEPLEGHWI